MNSVTRLVFRFGRIVLFLTVLLWSEGPNGKPLFQKPTFSFFYGVDLTFWGQDPTLSANIYSLSTTRDNPVFHEIKAHLGRLPFGLSFDLKFSFDNITNLGGIFSTNVGLGKNGGSGGGQILLLFPFGKNLMRLLKLKEDDGDFSLDKFSAFYAFRGRTFRWETTFTRDFFSRTNLDYYNEAGSRFLYGFNQPFGAQSRASDSKIGVVWKWGGPEEGADDDRDLDESLLRLWGGLHFQDLEAPTVLSIDPTNGGTRNPSFYTGEPLLYSHNEFGGIYFRGSLGTDPSDIQSLPTGLSVGAELGASVGVLRTRNNYVASSPGFGAIFSAGLNVGLALGERGKFRFAALLGVTADMSLMSLPGSIGEPGVVLKDLSYIASVLSTPTTVAANTPVYVGQFRSDSFLVPYLKVAVSF